VPTVRDVPRVIVTGSESTGKTTLAAQLAQALGTIWVPEFARRYAEDAARPLTASDIGPIAEGQVRAEVQGAGEWRVRFEGLPATPPLVQDTDLVSTLVYGHHYYGECPEWIEGAARERLGDLYLLCAPDLPWVADGVRDLPQVRAEMHEAFRVQLRAFGAVVVPVTGLGAARLEAGWAAVRGWRGARRL